MGRDVYKETSGMKCVICSHGETEPSQTTVTLERGGATVVFKSVPASVCENCGEAYVDESTTATLLEAMNSAADQGVLVDVREYSHA